MRSKMEEGRWKMADGRWLMWLCTVGLFMIHCLVFTSCKTEDDTIVYKDTRRWVEKTVAVVAPLSDPIMKARLERTAEWMLSSLHNAQLHDTLCIDLKLEWYDENGNDLKSLGERLANRDDLLAVIGPFDNDHADVVALYCQQKGKPLILPTASSESLIRRYAITSTGDGQQPFLWSLTETDISLSEVMLSRHAQMIRHNEWVGEIADSAGLFTPDNIYGQTFYEWAPFQATEMGIGFRRIEQYSDSETLYQKLRAFYGSLSTIDVNLVMPAFVVIDRLEQLAEISKIRYQWWGTDIYEYIKECQLNGASTTAELYDYMHSYQMLTSAWSPTFFVMPNLTDEAIEALSTIDAVICDQYEGFSPYADPMTGFEMSYEGRYGTKPTFAECKFYDALLLSAFAASYLEHHPEVDNLNAAVAKITTTDNILSGHAWSESGMELYLSALEQGQLIGFKGASGPVQFDSECFTAALNTTYVHWVILQGHVQHQGYYSRSGGVQTAQTLASWNWLVQNAEEDFDEQYSSTTAAITYPALTDQYAVLVQGSNGWKNYRHEADVLNIYQMLKAGGYDDDHIILVSADECADAPENSDKGAVLLPADAGQNVLLFWSGHGHRSSINGANEMVWRDEMAGNGMTDDLLAETLRTMSDQNQFRQMLVCLEPCFSSNMGKALEGIPGVLAICSAGPYEQSFADSWSNELGVWMCDRFSRNLVGHASANPSGTYRDLYLYCAQHTLGSHVSIYNYTNFGNLYTTGPKDFFVKK